MLSPSVTRRVVRMFGRQLTGPTAARGTGTRSHPASGSSSPGSPEGCRTTRSPAPWSSTPTPCAPTSAAPSSARRPRPARRLRGPGGPHRAGADPGRPARHRSGRPGSRCRCARHPTTLAAQRCRTFFRATANSVGCAMNPPWSAGNAAAVVPSRSTSAIPARWATCPPLLRHGGVRSVLAVSPDEILVPRAELGRVRQQRSHRWFVGDQGAHQPGIRRHEREPSDHPAAAAEHVGRCATGRLDQPPHIVRAQPRGVLDRAGAADVPGVLAHAVPPRGRCLVWQTPRPARTYRSPALRGEKDAHCLVGVAPQLDGRELGGRPASRTGGGTSRCVATGRNGHH